MVVVDVAIPCLLVPSHLCKRRGKQLSTWLPATATAAAAATTTTVVVVVVVTFFVPCLEYIGIRFCFQGVRSPCNVPGIFRP